MYRRPNKTLMVEPASAAVAPVAQGLVGLADPTFRMTKRGISLGLACLFVASGCGTNATRRGDFPFGAYPLQAVAYDFYYMSKTFGPGEELSGARVSGPWFLVGGLLSLPFDIFSDVLFLPIDIGGWIAGCERPWSKQP